MNTARTKKKRDNSYPVGAALAIMTRGYEDNEFWQTGDLVEICEPVGGFPCGMIRARNLSNAQRRPLDWHCAGEVSADRFKPLTSLAADLIGLAVRS